MIKTLLPRRTNFGYVIVTFNTIVIVKKKKTGRTVNSRFKPEIIRAPCIVVSEAKKITIISVCRKQCVNSVFGNRQNNVDNKYLIYA